MNLDNKGRIKVNNRVGYFLFKIFVVTLFITSIIYLFKQNYKVFIIPLIMLFIPFIIPIFLYAFNLILKLLKRSGD